MSEKLTNKQKRLKRLLKELGIYNAYVSSRHPMDFHGCSNDFNTGNDIPVDTNGV